ncbi:MAG: site-specific recombinase [Pseudonocardiales bacterium]|nr:site-specific recombinase [Pseudonocardiales bacterium]
MRAFGSGYTGLPWLLMGRPREQPAWSYGTDSGCSIQLSHNVSQWHVVSTPDEAMDGSVPGDIAREKQQQLGVQLAQAEEQRARLCSVQQDHERTIRAALRLLTDCGLAYEQGTDSTRRGYNQALFEKLFIDARADDTVVVRVERTELLEALRTAQVVQQETTDGLEQISEIDEEPLIPEGLGSWRYRVIADVRGSKVPCLVELTGLEPVTPALPVRCATSCATAPEEITTDLPRCVGNRTRGPW